MAVVPLHAAGVPETCIGQMGAALLGQPRKAVIRKIVALVIRAIHVWLPHPVILAQKATKLIATQKR